MTKAIAGLRGCPLLNVLGKEERVETSIQWVTVKVQGKIDKVLEWGPSREGKNLSGYGNQGKVPGEGDIDVEDWTDFNRRRKGLGGNALSQSRGVGKHEDTMGSSQ